MAKKKAKTSYKDANGEEILVHSYVKDAAGKTYYINSHHQAVPAGDDQDGAAIELERLMEQGPVTMMPIEEVLKSYKEAEEEPVEKPKRRAGRRPKAEKAKDPISKKKKALEKEKAEAEAAEMLVAKAKAEADAIAKAKAEAAERAKAQEKLDERLVLSAIPDAHLAAELRRRGYVVAAVKPIILQL